MPWDVIRTSVLIFIRFVDKRSIVSSKDFVVLKVLIGYVVKSVCYVLDSDWGSLGYWVIGSSKYSKDK